MHWQQTTKGKWNTYRQNARIRSIPFKLEYKEFVDIIESMCYYCGSEGYGIDRIDNSQGYIKDNCFPCCSKCNKMKSNLTLTEFLEQCKKITENRL